MALLRALRNTAVSVFYQDAALRIVWARNVPASWGDGDIAGAGLDVFEEEPKVHPGLCELDNVVLAPHLGSATVATRERMAAMAARNLIAVLEGQEPLSVVNPHVLG